MHVQPPLLSALVMNPAAVTVSIMTVPQQDQMSKTFPYILESSFFRNTLLEQLGTDTLNGTIHGGDH